MRSRSRQTRPRPEQAQPEPEKGATQDVALDQQIAQARAALQQRAASDEQACKKEVEELLERYNCRLRTMQLALDGQPGPINVDIVSNLRANLG